MENNQAWRTLLIIFDRGQTKALIWPLNQIQSWIPIGEAILSCTEELPPQPKIPTTPVPSHEFKLTRRKFP